MEKNDYLSYDENVDHLVIHKSEEKIIYNIDTGLAIFSLNSNKEIVGIEFMGANKNFKIPQEVLANLTGCKVEIKYNPENKTIVINAILQHKTQESPLVYTSSNLDFGKNAFTERFACST